MANARVSSARDLLGVTVGCFDDKPVGSVEDLVIDERSGRILYALVAPAAEIGRARELQMAIPWAAMARSGDGRHRWRLFLPEPLDRLHRAPMFRRAARPDFTDPRLMAEVHSYYGVQP